VADIVCGRNGGMRADVRGGRMTACGGRDMTVDRAILSRYLLIRKIISY